MCIRDRSRTHAYYGGTQGNFGALLEVHEHASDGFDSIANVGGDTGFDKSDLLFKARYESGSHSVTWKMVDLDETSNQSYVGLSQASFDANPRMRYGATKYDTMMNDGEQSSLTYVGDLIILMLSLLHGATITIEIGLKLVTLIIILIMVKEMTLMS